MRGTSAAALFFTLTSVGVPSASFLKVCSVSPVNTGSSIKATLALASSMNGKLVVPCTVAGYLYRAARLRAMKLLPELGTPSNTNKLRLGVFLARISHTSDTNCSYGILWNFSQ